MPLYSFTYFLNAAGFFAAGKQRRVVNTFVILLLVFMSGTRYYMGGSDVLVYEGMYNDVPDMLTVLTYWFTGVNGGVNTNYEIGYTLLCSVVKSLGFSYFGFILIWTLLFYTLMVKGLKEFVPNMAVFWAVFMYKLMFYNTFISIRQGLTIAMFCYMLRFIRDRKWYFYFPWCVIAFLEHRAALILFPLYFITYLPTSRNFLGVFSLLMLPTWLLRDKVDLTGLLRWVTTLIDNTKSLEQWTESIEQISIIHTLECYIVVVVVLVFYDKIMNNRRRREAKLALQLFMVTIPIFTLFSNWIVLTREKDYFVLMYGILFSLLLDDERPAQPDPHCVYFQPSHWRMHRLLSLGIIALCFIGMVRYVMTFDGGVLKDFTSFLFVKDAWIFQ